MLFPRKAGRHAHLSPLADAAPPTRTQRKELKTMASASQINANRENAKASTGPKTEEGKAKSSRNNTKFGLFTTNNCVQPEEKEDYDEFCSKLWTTLAPADPVEEVTAAEFVRNAWRLRRCAMAEESLGEFVARFQASQNKARNTDHPAADPMIYPTYLPAQTAIDRARTSAHNGMRRAKADLDKMQAARRKAEQACRRSAIRTQFRPGHARKNRARKARSNNSNPISAGSAAQRRAFRRRIHRLPPGRRQSAPSRGSLAPAAIKSSLPFAKYLVSESESEATTTPELRFHSMFFLRQRQSYQFGPRGPRRWSLDWWRSLGNCGSGAG